MAGNRGLSVGSSWCELCFQHRSSLAKKWYTPVTLFSDKVHNVLAMCFDSILDLLPAGHPWSLFDGWASKVASQVVRPMTIKTVIHRCIPVGHPSVIDLSPKLHRFHMDFTSDAWDNGRSTAGNRMWQGWLDDLAYRWRHRKIIFVQSPFPMLHETPNHRTMTKGVRSATSPKWPQNTSKIYRIPIRRTT